MFKAIFCEEDFFSSIFSTPVEVEGTKAYDYLAMAIQQHPKVDEFYENTPYDLTIYDEKLKIKFSHTVTKITDTEYRQYINNSEKKRYAKYASIKEALRLEYKNNKIINTHEKRNLHIVISPVDKPIPRRMSDLDEVRRKLSWDEPTAATTTFPLKDNPQKKKSISDGEHYPGINLKQYILNNLVYADFEKRIDVAISLVQALKELHRKQISHRNLTPEFVQYDEQSQTAKIELDIYSAKIGDKNPSWKDNFKDNWKGDLYYAGKEIALMEFVTSDMDIGNVLVIIAEILGFKDIFKHREPLIKSYYNQLNIKYEIIKTRHHMHVSESACPELLRPALNALVVKIVKHRPALEEILKFLEQDMKNQFQFVRKIETIQKTCTPYQDHLYKEILKGIKTLSHDKSKDYLINNQLNIQKIYADFSDPKNSFLIDNKYLLAIKKHKTMNDLQQKLIDKNILSLEQRIKNFETSYKLHKTSLQTHRDKISQWFAEKINSILEKITKNIISLHSTGYKLTLSLDTLFYSPKLVKK